MDFFKRLFGGGAAASGGDRGLYFYVRPTGCTEVVRIRIDPMNELSQEDEGGGYFVRKMVRGTDYKCNRSAELLVSMGGDKRIRNTEVTGGTLVQQADYDAWVASGSS
jgi:hypothetical protein